MAFFIRDYKDVNNGSGIKGTVQAWSLRNPYCLPWERSQDQLPEVYITLDLRTAKFCKF